MQQFHQPGLAPKPKAVGDELAKNQAREHAAFLAALEDSLRSNGLLAEKISWCTAQARKVLDGLSADEALRCHAALFGAPPWAANKTGKSSIVQSEPALAEICSAVARALAGLNLGSVGFEKNVEPLLKGGALPVFVANQRHMTDSALIAATLGDFARDKLVEFSCSDSFPNDFVRSLLQGGRTIVRTGQTVESALGQPLETLSGSPFAALFAAMRAGKAPLLFPEGQGIELMAQRAHRAFQHMLKGNGDRVPAINTFKPSAIAPLMTHDLETMGLDAEKIVVVPVRILNTGDFWHRYSVCDEIDTIVKFGTGMPLASLHAAFGRQGDIDGLRRLCAELHSSLLGIGESYLD